MSKTTICFLLCFIVSSIHAKLKPQSLSIHFQSGSYTLSPSSIQTLDSLIQTLKPDDDFEILLEGHTDNIGDLNFNDSLSSKRVQSVQYFLKARGIQEEVLTSNFFGERNPDKPNNSEENKFSNRRVELHLVRYHFENIDALEDALVDVNNDFQIDPKSSHQIKGRAGVQLQIPANAFVTKDGKPVEEEVNIKLTEALDLSSFISHNLTTISHGKMLQSGGMINISAQTLSGEEVLLDSTKNLEIKVPYQNFEKGMEIFTSDEGDDWAATGQAVATDALDLKSLRPIVDLSKLRYFKVPHFKRDYTGKPSKPELIGKPKVPKRPDETKYFSPIKWYQLPVSGVIKKRQNESYTRALSRYEDNRASYKRRREHYERYSEEYHTKMKVYHAEYGKWNDLQLTDSLDFKNTEAYKNAVSMNDKIRKAIWDKQKMADIEWRRRIDSAMAAYSDDSPLNSTVINSYVMNYNQLSWINIDRFLKYKPSDLRPVTMKDNDKTGEKTFIVFTEMKSLLPMSKSKNGRFYTRDGIPKNEKTVLLSYKVRDGKALVYYEEISGKKMNYTPVYKHYKISEFRDLLKDLNG